MSSLAEVSRFSPVPCSSHAARLGSECKFPPLLQRSSTDLKTETNKHKEKTDRPRADILKYLKENANGDTKY